MQLYSSSESISALSITWAADNRQHLPAADSKGEVVDGHLFVSCDFPR